MKLGEWLFLSWPTVGVGVDQVTFEARQTGEMAAEWNTRVPGLDYHLFLADRGTHEDEYLSAWTTGPNVDPADAWRKLSARDSEAGAATAFQLIGAAETGDLPSVDLLGIHVLQVTLGKEEAFERFAREKLHPAFATRFPGMRLLYYKGIQGDKAGVYLLVFAIETPASRERYFPTGQPETAELRDGFGPLKAIGEELTTYLEPDTWLKPETGAAAAYFESLDWTDYLQLGAKDR